MLSPKSCTCTNSWMMICYHLPDLLHIGTKSVCGENSTKESSLSVFFHETHAAALDGLQQKVNISWGQGPVTLTQQAVQGSSGGVLGDVDWERCMTNTWSSSGCSSSTEGKSSASLPISHCDLRMARATVISCFSFTNGQTGK